MSTLLDAQQKAADAKSRNERESTVLQQQAPAMPGTRYDDEFDEQATTCDSQKHAETVFSSQAVEKPLRAQLPTTRILSALLLIVSCAGLSFYYIQDRERELQRQLTAIAKHAPIVPLEQLQSEETAPTPVETTNSTEQTSEVVAIENTESSELNPDQNQLPTIAAVDKENASVAVDSVKNSSSQAAATDNPASQPQAASKRAAAPKENGLNIVQTTRQSAADVLVRDAYAAYQADALSRAEALYRQALQADAQHRDALLGRAAIFLKRNETRPAIAIYRQLLAVNPRDHGALAGLNSLASEGNFKRYEADLRFLLKETPNAAPLNYALGTLLSRQQRWGDAQTHFFKAHATDPENPDLAFNLAVSLDNLGKSRPATSYYRSALNLAKTRLSSFDKLAVHRRLQMLEQ